MTYQVSADYAYQNFDSIIQQARQEAEGIVIVQGDRKFVLIEQSKLKNVREEEQFDQLSNLFKNVAPIAKQYSGKTIDI